MAVTGILMKKLHRFDSVPCCMDCESALFQNIPQEVCEIIVVIHDQYFTAVCTSKTPNDRNKSTPLRRV